GFYDRVRGWSEQNHGYMRQFGPSDAKTLADASVKQGCGETSYTLYERTTIRPALTINGVTGSYQGPGVKAVIPVRASAKLNFRLAPGQDPQVIDWLFRAYISRITPTTVRASLRTHLAAKPAIVNRRHRAILAAATAHRTAFGVIPVFLRSG